MVEVEGYNLKQAYIFVTSLSISNDVLWLSGQEIPKRSSTGERPVVTIRTHTGRNGSMKSISPNSHYIISLHLLLLVVKLRTLTKVNLIAVLAENPMERRQGRKFQF